MPEFASFCAETSTDGAHSKASNNPLVILIVQLLLRSIWESALHSSSSKRVAQQSLLKNLRRESNFRPLDPPKTNSEASARVADKTARLYRGVAKKECRL